MATMKTENKYFKFLLKQNKRMIGLYLLILLASFPLLLLFCNSYASYAFYTYALVGQTLNLIVALIASMIIPLSIFKHTTSKKSIDVYDALPLQKETMFRTHYMVGLLILLVPLIISWVIGVIYVSTVWPNVLNVEGSSLYLSELEYFNLTTQFKHLIELLVPISLSYSIGVCVKQNTGTTIDAAIYTAIVHALPMLAYWTFYAYCATTLLGFSSNFSIDTFLFLAPICTPFRIIFSETSNFISLPMMAYYAVLTVILFVFSSYLYVNRKAERAEQPFTTKHFFPLVSNSAIVILLILLICLMDVDVFLITKGNIRVLYPILLSLIAYLLLDVIAHRGFKNIYKASIKFIFITIISLTLLAPIRFTNGFGYVTRIPDINEIESIEVDVPYFVSEQLGFQQNTLNITSKENIEKIVDYHEYLLERYEAYDYQDDTVIYDEAINDYVLDTYATLNYTFKIKYHTKEHTITRQYHRVPFKWTKKLLELDNNDDIINSKLLPRSISNYFNDPKYRIICTYIEYNDEYNKSTIVAENDYTTAIDANKFLKAYHQDLENRKHLHDYEITESPYMNLFLRFEVLLNETTLDSNTNPLYAVDMDGRYYSIEKCDTNTIAYLNSIGITPNTAFKEELVEKAYLIRSTDTNAPLFFYSLRPTDDFYRFDLNIEYYELTYEDIVSLSPYIRSNAYYNKEGYVLCIDYGEYSEDFFIISGEHKHIVDTLIKNKTSQTTTSTTFVETLLRNEKYY